LHGLHFFFNLMINELHPLNLNLNKKTHKQKTQTYKKNWKELQGEDGAIVCENLGTIGSYVLSNDLNTLSSSKETGLEEAGPLRIVIRPSSVSPILTDADIAVFNVCEFPVNNSVETHVACLICSLESL
jgi:hypothetical protein